MKYICLSLIILLFLASACSDEVYTPKPRGYFRDNFPPKEYVHFDSVYPYTFDYPAYAYVKDDLSKGAEKYWANIFFPNQKAQIYLSYKPLDNNLAELTEDTRKFAFKHSIKADAINPIDWVNPEKNVYGLLYEIKGNAASTLQFYLTDSLHHFVRGSLYFNVLPNKDSLAPSQKFLRTDVDKLIESFEWKNQIAKP